MQAMLRACRIRRPEAEGECRTKLNTDYAGSVNDHYALVAIDNTTK